MGRTEHQIIRYLALSHDGLSATELKSLIRPVLSQPTLWRRLRQLITAGYVRSAGRGRATRYRLQISDHIVIDLRSKAQHQAIGRKLVQQPRLTGNARRFLAGMYRTNPYSKPYLDRWDTLLAGPLEGVLQVLGADTEEAVALRHVSPFAGILTERERLSVLRDQGLYR